MSAPSRWGQTPRQSIEAEVALRGRDAVVTGCLDLLAGREVDPSLVLALGGPPARWVVDGGGAGRDYWLRVWSLRGLLWNWDDRALPAVLDALHDDAWRVREMAAKVTARHGLGEALPQLVELRKDEVVRVRQAAHRAIARLTAAGA